MSHPRWPGFDAKTGNPVVDNQHRRLNQMMYRSTQASFRIVGARGRKRKKLLMRVEGGNYIALFAAVMRDVAGRHRDAAHT